MHPVLFRIPLPWGGHFDVASYGMMLAVGALAGVIAAARLGKREGISAETVIDLGFWTVFPGVVGAKLWYLVQNWGTVSDKMELLRGFRGGLVYYGGILGAATAVVLFARRRRIHILKMLDLASPPAMLGLAFGRIGCFLNGCCYGKVTTAAWGVRYGLDSPAYFDQIDKKLITKANTAPLPVEPTQFIEAAGALIVLAVLLTMRRRRRFYGEQTALLLALYAVVRFSVEFLRGDNQPVGVGLTIPQLFSVAMFVIGTAIFVYLRTARPASVDVSVADARQAVAPEQLKPARVKKGRKGR